MSSLLKRSLAIALGAVLVPALFTACEQSPTETVDAEVAKHHKPDHAGGPGGGDDDGGSSSGIVEYWVDHDAGPDGEDMIHVVVDQDVDIDTDVVYDYFGNGVQNHFDSPDHYEWVHSGRAEYAVEEVSGLYHVDIPWDGGALNQDGHPQVFFPDYPMTDLDGAGADPFAFQVEFLDGGDVTDTFHPQGVIVDGSTGGLNATPSSATGHPNWSSHEVFSYATHTGDSPTTSISVQGFSVSSFDCTVESYTAKGGGPPRTEYRTILSADVDVELSAATDPETEFHFRNATDDASAPRIRESFNDVSSFSVSVSDTIDGDHSGDEYRLWMDYLYVSVIAEDGHAYDPGGNSNSGFSTITRSYSTQDLHDWAVVESGESVTCQ